MYYILFIKRSLLSFNGWWTLLCGRVRRFGRVYILIGRARVLLLFLRQIVVVVVLLVYLPRHRHSALLLEGVVSEVWVRLDRVVDSFLFLLFAVSFLFLVGVLHKIRRVKLHNSEEPPLALIFKVMRLYLEYLIVSDVSRFSLSLGLISFYLTWAYSPIVVMILMIVPTTFLWPSTHRVIVAHHILTFLVRQYFIFNAVYRVLPTMLIVDLKLTYFSGSLRDSRASALSDGFDLIFFEVTFLLILKWASLMVDILNEILNALFPLSDYLLFYPTPLLPLI